MKRILIVGKNSYIGNCFEQFIKSGESTKMEYVISKISASSGEWKETDYSNYDVVILLSGLVHKKESNYGYENYHRVNYEMAVEIAKRAKAAKVKQFIFASTMAVFGDQAVRIGKNTKPQPTTYYGKTKLMAEETILGMTEESFQVAVVRPPMVYGKDCKGNFIRLVELTNKVPIFPKVNNKRSMIYIENLCEFLHLLIERESSGIFHPQNQELVCTCEMVKEIRRQQHKKLWVVPGVSWLIKLGMKRVRSLSKMFGDCYYEKEISEYDGMNYWIVDEKESIKKSV